MTGFFNNFQRTVNVSMTINEFIVTILVELLAKTKTTKQKLNIKEFELVESNVKTEIDVLDGGFVDKVVRDMVLMIMKDLKAMLNQRFADLIARNLIQDALELFVDIDELLGLKTTTIANLF